MRCTNTNGQGEEQNNNRVEETILYSSSDCHRTTEYSKASSDRGCCNSALHPGCRRRIPLYCRLQSPHHLLRPIGTGSPSHQKCSSKPRPLNLPGTVVPVNFGGRDSMADWRYMMPESHLDTFDLDCACFWLLSIWMARCVRIKPARVRYVKTPAVTSWDCPYSVRALVRFYRCSLPEKFELDVILRFQIATIFSRKCRAQCNHNCVIGYGIKCLADAVQSPVGALKLGVYSFYNYVKENSVISDTIRRLERTLPKTKILRLAYKAIRKTTITVGMNFEMDSSINCNHSVLLLMHRIASNRSSPSPRQFQWDVEYRCYSHPLTVDFAMLSENRTVYYNICICNKKGNETNRKIFRGIHCLDHKLTNDVNDIAAHNGTLRDNTFACVRACTSPNARTARKDKD
uniref:Uncharacterized protein n=1 Tax=Glossina pallidipes TaxID=7398 RepID=A0A1A9ZIU8_GLOPL